MGNRTLPQKSSFHYAWVIVAAEFILTGICVGILINCMGVFVKPVSESLGIERSKFTLVITISSLVSTVFYPFWGNYMKKGSIRRLYIISALVIPLVFLGFSFSHKVWHFYLISVVMGFISASVTTLATSSIINRWFVERQGIALSLASSGSGLLSSLFIPKIAELIERHGWQYSYRWLACVYFSVVLACSFLILRDRPEDKGLKPFGYSENTLHTNSAVSEGITKGQAIKSTSFYLLLAASFFCGLIYNGVHSNVQAYLTDIGYSTFTAARVASISMLTMVFSKLTFGVMYDRFGFKICYITTYASTVLAGICLLMAKLTPAIYIYAVAFGVTASFPSLSCSYGTASLFGLKDFSSICGLVISAVYLGLASGPSIISAFYDLSGSYTGSWVLVCTLSILTPAILSAASKAADKLPKT